MSWGRRIRGGLRRGSMCEEREGGWRIGSSWVVGDGGVWLCFEGLFRLG